MVDCLVQNNRGQNDASSCGSESVACVRLPKVALEEGANHPKKGYHPSVLVFDFDGTLVSGTNEAYIECYYQSVYKIGCRIPFDLVRARVLERWGSSPTLELLNVLRGHPQIVGAALQEYNKLIRSAFFANRVCAIPGAGDALKALRESGLKLAVISGMPADLLQFFSHKFEFGFEKENLISTADTDDADKQKHTGYHFKHLMKERGWRAEEVLVVGDAKADVDMARAVSAKSAAVLTGWFSRETAPSALADFVLPSVATLPALIH